MGSRQQEKERRRQERLEREQAAAREAARKRRLKIIAGAGLGVAAVAVIVVVVAAGGGGGDTASAATVASKARAAGCQFHQYPSAGREHTAEKVKYRTNPPTSGSHNPTPAPDGAYAPGKEPAPENYVHTLEHGRVEFQFKPGTPNADVRRFAHLAAEPFNGTADYHVLLFENNTKMPTQYAVTAWTRSIQCDSLSAAAVDAMRAFRKAFTDKAPEQIP